MSAANLAGRDEALRALCVPFEHGAITLPDDGRVLFLGARAGSDLARWATPGWCCVQTFKPFADALRHAGLGVGTPDADARYGCVLLLPARQRDEARMMLARAAIHAAADGVIVASAANHAGARSLQADMEALLGPVEVISKHKCRVMLAKPETRATNASLRDQWLAFDALRENATGLLSRPGLFAWDHVDAASALLAECMPASLAGRAADLGAGTGFLSVALIRQCVGIRAVDLYEADARALPAARANLAAACSKLGRDVECAVHWHDVTTGIEGGYDVIISNPPFHQGHADLPELGRAFIASAAGGLRKGGVLWMVANRHLPYEATLRVHFAQVRTVAERDGFKVIKARR
ncbi:MAG TPA: methyltransferase [Rhodanobacteraceae bacterium]